MTALDLPAPFTLAVEAPAKINLSLRIIGKRPDGYHQLESLMLKLALADRLLLKRREDDRFLFRCGGELGELLPADENNLVVRAARAFFAHTGLPAGVEMQLEKKVPVAAGLGGGSSDAAATLLGLNELCGTSLSQAELAVLAAPLGADVPFFVQPAAAAWAEGIGEILTPTPTPEVGWILLVNPGFAVSTQWVYQNFRLTTGHDPFILGRPMRPAKSAGSREKKWLGRLHNDLESVTLARWPELVRIKEELTANGAGGALMSGSGPTMFGLFADQAAAEQCREKMQTRYPQVFLTRPLVLT